MFTINDISKAYGSNIVLDQVSLAANEGEAIGILGANGSGKSTLLSCIAKASANNPDYRIGYLPQENPLFDELKPIDNLRMWTDLSKKEILAMLNEPPISDMGIDRFLDTPVRKMSGGMKKRVSLVSVLINRPQVLLLDEPFAALDLPAKQDFLADMNAFLKQKGIIIVASHEEEIFRFCNRVYLLKDAKLYDTEELSSQGKSYMEMLRN